MNSIIKLFLIALVQFVLINAHAVNFEKRSEVVIDNLRYDLNYNDYTATVLGFAKGKSQQFLTIPSKVAVKYEVTKIDAYAFQDDSTLFQVTIPSTVTDVGVFSFRRCKNLDKVYFNYAPKGRIIRGEAFNNDHTVVLAFTDFSGRYYGTLYEFYRSFATVEQRSKYAKEVIDNYKNHYIYYDAASNEKRTYIKFDASSNSGTVAEFPKQKAHNIYSDPKIPSNTKMDIYMIDIKPKTNARYTFWNANQMKMDMSYYKNKGYTVKQEMSSTSGLQYGSSISDQKNSFSIGKAIYNDGKKDITITPSRIYPSTGVSGTTSKFSFTENEWNTVLYRTWTEVEGTTLTTKVGQWVRCYNQSPYWRVAAVYNTHVAESSMTGSMSFWQENFSPDTSDYEREVHIKGMYYRNNSDKKWVSVPSTYLSTDTYFNDKKGGFSYGSNGSYFYGKAGNPVNGSQLEFEKKNAVKRLYTINQDSKPYMEKLSVAKAYYTYNEDNSPVIHVDLYPYSSPIFKVVINFKVTNSSGTQNGSVTVYDPNFKSYHIAKIDGKKAKISITVYDVFDQTYSSTLQPY